MFYPAHVYQAAYKVKELLANAGDPDVIDSLIRILEKYGAVHLLDW